MSRHFSTILGDHVGHPSPHFQSRSKSTDDLKGAIYLLRHIRQSKSQQMSEGRWGWVLLLGSRILCCFAALFGRGRGAEDASPPLVPSMPFAISSMQYGIICYEIL